MKIFDKFKKTSLVEFSGENVQVEWLKGNNLRITFLSDSYVRAGATITVNAPIILNDITPGKVYPRITNEYNN